MEVFLAMPVLGPTGQSPNSLLRGEGLQFRVLCSTTMGYIQSVFVEFSLAMSILGATGQSLQ
jgi:hypothetical protein